MIRSAQFPASAQRPQRPGLAAAAVQDQAPAGAAWAFLAAALLAIAAAGMVAAGEAAHSQLKLAKASVEAMEGLQRAKPSSRSIQAKELQ